MDDFKRWMNHIDKFIHEDQTNCYAENAFNEISEEIPLYSMEIDKEFCMEIDTLEDLKKANEIAKD